MTQTKEERRISKRDWNRAHPEENKVRSKAWRDSHPEEVERNNKNYYTEHFEENKSRRRNSNLKHKYGINNEEYDRLFELQKGRCAICGLHQLEFTKRLYIDHNHETGTIRGLLCHDCNTAIGFLRDDSTLLKIAFDYLEKWNNV